MFSRTYAERFPAASTKNTTIPNKSNTNMVLMAEVINCISKNEPVFFPIVIIVFF